jgi:putative hydrolase of the HAD superfamily
MIKGIIFDLDNTLVDFTRFKENSIRSAIESMIDAGLKIDPETAYKKIFQIYEEKGWEYQRVFDDFLIEVMGYIDYKILASGIVAYRRAKEGSLVLYPNVTRTLLNLVKKGIKLAVVSDAPALQVWTRLVQMNLHHIFDVVITFDDTGKRKPDPEPFLKALEKLNLKPNEVIMVGDWAERDIVGAKKVGIKTIFAKYGNTFGTINSGADWEIDDIEEIVKIVDEINSKLKNQLL